MLIFEVVPLPRTTLSLWAREYVFFAHMPAAYFSCIAIELVFNSPVLVAILLPAGATLTTHQGPPSWSA